VSTRTTTTALAILGGTCAGILMVAVGEVVAQSAQPQDPGSIEAMVRAIPQPLPSYTHPLEVRELAWSAWTAGRDRVQSAQPMLERMVSERLDAAPSSPPVDFALDALIQLQARLAPPLLSRIAERRPVEGLILLSHLDDGSGDGVLLATLKRQTGYEWFAAANLLLRRRPPGFAAGLLDGLRLRARITVSRTGEGLSFSDGSGGGIGHSVMELHPGMPPWPSYGLTPSPDAGAVLLAVGPTPIHHRRRVSTAGTSPNRGGPSIDGPTAEDRLRYVAALSRRTPALRDHEHRGVRRRPDLNVEAVAARLRRDIERRHRRLLRDLVAGGFLTPIEARRLSVSVDVTVHKVDH
jgi:hypothetical protein